MKYNEKTLKVIDSLAKNLQEEIKQQNPENDRTQDIEVSDSVKAYLESKETDYKLKGKEI